jgi:hypothetical protein
MTYMTLHGCQKFKCLHTHPSVYIKPVLQLMSVEQQRLTKFRGRDCTYSGCFLKNATNRSFRYLLSDFNN